MKHPLSRNFMNPHSPFAVITGASRGIGAAYAEILASKGYDLLLVARNMEKLENMARSLRQVSAGIQISMERIDLAREGSAQALFQQVKTMHRPVSLLVNNAGFGAYGPFATMPHQEMLDMLHLHVQQVTESTRLFLPEMIAAGQGAIINVSSIAGLFPIPFMAEYAATKAYIIAFTEAVAREVRAKGVTVQACCPGFTDTDFHSTAGHRPRHIFFPQPPSQVAHVSLKALGSKKTLVTIGWQGRLAHWAVTLLPKTVLISMAEQFVQPRPQSS